MCLMTFSVSYRSGSHTRTRSRCYWVHLRRRRSSSSRNATGAATRTRACIHTDIQYIYKYIYRHSSAAHFIGSSISQLVNFSQVGVPKWTFVKKMERSQCPGADRQFTPGGTCRDLKLMTLSTQDPTYSCVTIILQSVPTVG